MNASALPLYLFARAPVAGKAKTRMRPQLAPRQCAALASHMLFDSARRVARFWRGEKILCVTPTTGHPAFRQIAGELGFRLEMQQGADLGERMFNAIAQGVANAGSAAVMGCDVPHCPGTVLTDTHALMRAGKNRLCPAADGGFYLFAVHCAAPGMFAGITWGGSRVYAKLAKNLECLGMEFAVGPCLRDIDCWDDLVWLADRDSRYEIHTRSR